MLGDGEEAIVQDATVERSLSLESGLTFANPCRSMESGIAG
jgi:hypothetical protein